MRANQGGIAIAADTACRVLVAAASKHGATAQIAEHIGEILSRRGCDVTVAAPANVTTVEGYDAIVLGSAVYAGHWLTDATHLGDFRDFDAITALADEIADALLSGTSRGTSAP